MDDPDRGRPEPRRSFLGLRLAAVVILAISVVALAQTFQIRQGVGYQIVGPRLFPVLTTAGLFLFGLLFLARTTPLWPDHDLAEEAAQEEAATDWTTVGLITAALIVYPFTLGPLGYPIATALFFPVVSRIMGSRRLLRDILVGIGMGVVIYLAFTQFLGVRLPAGWLQGLL